MHASLHVCAFSRLDGVKIYVRVHSESLKQTWDWSGSSKKARTCLKCWTMLNCWVLAWSANFRQTPATKLFQFWCLLPLHCSLCSCCSGVCKSTTINPWPESILSKIQNTSKILKIPLQMSSSWPLQPLQPLNSDLDRFGMAWIDFFQGGWCAFSDIMPSSMMWFSWQCTTCKGTKESKGIKRIQTGHSKTNMHNMQLVARWLFELPQR